MQSSSLVCLEISLKLVPIFGAAGCVDKYCLCADFLSGKSAFDAPLIKMLYLPRATNADLSPRLCGVVHFKFLPDLHFSRHVYALPHQSKRERN